MTDENIKKDYIKVVAQLAGIVEGEYINAFVGDPDYLNPSIKLGSPDLPLNSEKGTFAYFNRILQGLTEALQTGKITENKAAMQKARAPQYICDLFE